MNVNNTRKRKRNHNWNNKDLPSPKRARLSKKVSFKNTPNVKNLNISNNAINYRKAVQPSALTRESENIEHMIQKAIRQKRGNTKVYRNKIRNNLKSQNKLFKE